MFADLITEVVPLAALALTPWATTFVVNLGKDLAARRWDKAAKRAAAYLVALAFCWGAVRNALHWGGVPVPLMALAVAGFAGEGVYPVAELTRRLRDASRALAGTSERPQEPEIELHE